MPAAVPLSRQRLSLNSPRKLSVPGASAVSVFRIVLHRRDAEHAEDARRKTKLSHYPLSLPPFALNWPIVILPAQFHNHLKAQGAT